MRYAILDIGSHSIKLNIFDERCNELHKDKVMGLDLGKGMSADKRLDKGRMMANLEALKTLKSRIDSYRVSKIRAVATSALREASNAGMFLEMVREATGIEIEIISQRDEAIYFFKGLVSDLNHDGDIVALNAGGRSTEVIIGNKERIHNIYMLPIGCVTVTDSYLKSDPSRESEWEDAIGFIRETVKAHNISEKGNFPCFFTGDVLTYCRVVSEQYGTLWQACDLSAEHPIKTTLAEYERFNDMQKTLTIEERRSLLPHNPIWMDHAAPGSQIYIEIAREIGCDMIVPSDADLRDGLMIDSVERG